MVTSTSSMGHVPLTIIRQRNGKDFTITTTKLIDVLVTNEDVTKPKPDPEIYIKTMKILGVDADRTLVIEDHEVGVRSAQAAGCRVVQVLGVDDVGVPLLEPYFESVTEGGKN